MIKDKTIFLSFFTDDQEISLSHSHMIIGSADHADIKITAETTSHYHALLVIKNHKFFIQDLQSLNGTYVNGMRIFKETQFFEGDKVTIGDVHYHALEGSQKKPLINNDDHIKKLHNSFKDKIHIPKKDKESQVLIDDEYCDIIFDDQEQSRAISPLANFSFNASDFIALEEFEEESFELLDETNEQCLQITTLLNGIILEQYYFALQDGAVLGSSTPKKGEILIESLSSFKGSLAKIQHGLITLEQVTPFALQASESSGILDKNLNLSHTHGAYQINYQVTTAPNHITDISSLKRDKSFYQTTFKRFAAVMLPMLLLLLIDFSLPKKEEKKLTIIYKKPTKALQDNKKMASKNPTSKDKNDGHKSTKQPEKKISRSKKGQKKKQKTKKVKVQKVAKSKTAPKRKTKAKTKTYKFKVASNVKSLFSKSKSVALKPSRSVASINSKSFATTSSQSLNTKVTGTSQAEVGNLGSDSSGKLASFGSKGLSSRKGRDSAYIQTKTVVLGSMDPELLRKILQQYLPQFRHCYQQELVYNSEDIKGVVDLNFEISKSGKVGKIKVKAKDSRFSKKGTKCMARVLAIIDFPKPKGGGRVAVKQPLNFFSEQEKS